MFQYIPMFVVPLFSELTHCVLTAMIYLAQLQLDDTESRCLDYHISQATTLDGSEQGQRGYELLYSSNMGAVMK